MRLNGTTQETRNEGERSDAVVQGLRSGNTTNTSHPVPFQGLWSSNATNPSTPPPDPTHASLQRFCRSTPEGGIVLAEQSSQRLDRTAVFGRAE